MVETVDGMNFMICDPIIFCWLFIFLRGGNEIEFGCLIIVLR